MCSASRVLHIFCCIQLGRKVILPKSTPGYGLPPPSPSSTNLQIHRGLAKISVCLSFPLWRGSLVHIAHGARAGAARITAGTAGSRSGRRTRALGRDGEHRELRLKFLRMAFRALGLVFSVDEGLELVMAFFADVLVNRHVRLRYLLESNSWGVRKSAVLKIMFTPGSDGGRESRFGRGAGSRVDTCRPSPVFLRREKFIFLRRKSGWWKLCPG